MYTDKDYDITSKKMWTRLVLFSLFALALLGVVIALNKLRLMLPMMIGSGAAFVLCYFIWSFKVQPWVKYYKFMREMRSGQRRTTLCDFVSAAEETLMREGVEVRQFITRVGAEDEDERLFYWDADKPMPEFLPGQRLNILSYGNIIVDCKTIT